MSRHKSRKETLLFNIVFVVHNVKDDTTNIYRRYVFISRPKKGALKNGIWNVNICLISTTNPNTSYIFFNI